MVETLDFGKAAHLFVLLPTQCDAGIARAVSCLGAIEDLAKSFDPQHFAPASGPGRDLASSNKSSGLQPGDCGKLMCYPSAGQ